MAGRPPRGRLPKNVYWDKDRAQYFAILDLGKDASGTRRRKKMYARTQKEVLEKLERAKAERDAGIISSERDTVSKLLRDYLAELDADGFKSERTRQGYVWAIEDHLIPSIGGRKVKELSPADVRAMLNAKRDAGLSRATLLHIHGILKRALSWGQEQKRVPPEKKTAAELVRTPQAKVERRQGKSLTVEEARKVLRKAAEDEDRLEALYALGLDVPCRPGELLGLPWSAIDFDAGVIEFRQAVHRSIGGSGLYLGPLKTEESHRRVKVSSHVIDALKRRKRAQIQEREWCLSMGIVWGDGWTERPGAVGPDLDANLVFTTRVGTPMDSANVRRSFRGLLKRAGIAGDWTTYELRHSAISILSADGVDVDDISKSAGHSNRGVTETVYRRNLRPVIVRGTGAVARLLADETG